MNNTDLIEYYGQHSLEDCAQRFGMSFSGISYRLKKLGINLRTRKETARLTGRAKLPKNQGQSNHFWK